MRTELLETSFRIHRDEVTRTLIGCPRAYGRMAKIGFDPIATEWQLRRNRIFHVSNVILTAYVFLRNFRNGRMATEWWKPGISGIVRCLARMCLLYGISGSHSTLLFGYIWLRLFVSVVACMYAGVPVYVKLSNTSCANLHIYIRDTAECVIDV